LLSLLSGAARSLHGYYVVNHNELNPQIGSREDLEDS
jgi:maltooligosyltrehalose synthase